MGEGNRIGNVAPSYSNWLGAMLGLLILAGLYAISRYNFLLFHCLTEAFSIVIAIAVFAIFWNTRQYFENGAYLILGFGCLFAGVLDLIYIFAYKGMSVFPGADGNIALQAKTAAQWFVSLSCVGAVPFFRRKVNPGLALGVYLALLALALGTIFYWRVFPDCYREDVGQTGFERIGLVISCCAYLAAVALLFRNQPEFDRYVFKLLVATLTAFFIEDFASALATEIEGLGKTVAHLCQVVALYFVYKAFVEVGLRKPYDLLFRRQQRSEEERHRAELAHVARLSMMGEMAASLVHELNQPLHAVNNYAHGSIRRLMKMPERDEDLVAAIRQISDEANRAAEIVRRVRRFVQKREPQCSEVHVNRLVEEVVLLSQTELEQRQTRIVLGLSENLPPILGDPIQIEQVIMNLVRNALEAMDETPDDRRILDVRTARNDDDAIQVDVCDGGSGIGEQDLERLFQPFFTTKPEGMGMGLAISRSIIEAHGGHLWASVNRACGCTFHFTLPIGKRD